MYIPMIQGMSQELNLPELKNNENVYEDGTDDVLFLN